MINLLCKQNIPVAYDREDCSACERVTHFHKLSHSSSGLDALNKKLFGLKNIGIGAAVAKGEKN